MAVDRWRGVGAVGTTRGAGMGAAGQRARGRRWRWAAACRRHGGTIGGQASAQRSVQAMVRSASSGATCCRAQCMPLPFSRASPTSVVARSTAPLPLGEPHAWTAASGIGSQRLVS
jgi:hypothetical protein